MNIYNNSEKKIQERNHVPPSPCKIQTLFNAGNIEAAPAILKSIKFKKLKEIYGIIIYLNFFNIISFQLLSYSCFNSIKYPDIKKNKIIVEDPIRGKVIYDKVLDDNKELFKSKLNSRNNLITFETSADVDIWNNISISAVNESSESFIYLTVNDVKFLFCPSGGDAYNLPIDWTTPAFAIYGDIPDNDNMIKSNYIILTMSEDDLKGKTKPVVVNNKNVFTTSMNDMILIDCIGNNEISIHR